MNDREKLEAEIEQHIMALYTVADRLDNDGSYKANLVRVSAERIHELLIDLQHGTALEALKE